jgi:hypothetical protein
MVMQIIETEKLATIVGGALKSTPDHALHVSPSVAAAPRLEGRVTGFGDALASPDYQPRVVREPVFP